MIGSKLKVLNPAEEQKDHFMWHCIRADPSDVFTVRLEKNDETEYLAMKMTQGAFLSAKELENYSNCLQKRR